MKWESLGFAQGEARLMDGDRVAAKITPMGEDYRGHVFASDKHDGYSTKTAKNVAGLMSWCVYCAGGGE